MGMVEPEFPWLQPQHFKLPENLKISLQRAPRLPFLDVELLGFSQPSNVEIKDLMSPFWLIELLNFINQMYSPCVPAK